MKKLLHEDAQDKRRYALPYSAEVTVQEIKQAEVFCLDDAFVRLAMELRNQLPRQVNQLRLAAHPPYRTTWLEMSAKTYLEILDQMVVASGQTQLIETLRDRQRRQPDARMALLIHDLGDGLMEVGCIEHGEKTTEIFEWPARFVVAYGDTDVKAFKANKLPDQKAVTVSSGNTDAMYQAARMWGYAPGTAGLTPLKHTAAALMKRHMYSALHSNDPRSTQLFETITDELSGLTRFAVACLSLLNSIAEVEPPTQPKGRFMNGSSTRPYSVRSYVRLRVPKRIRDVEKYAMGEIRAAGRRLHQVRGHFRYLRREPMTPGWERWEHEGEVFFRKWIEPCLRGDETLGVVDRMATLVSGR